MGRDSLWRQRHKLFLHLFCWLPTLTQQFRQRNRCGLYEIHFNPLSPSIHIQILQTDLHAFPLRISWENLIKHQGIFSFVIIFLYSHNLISWQCMDFVRRKLLLVTIGLKGLKIERIGSFELLHNISPQVTLVEILAVKTFTYAWLCWAAKTPVSQTIVLWNIYRLQKGCLRVFNIPVHNFWKWLILLNIFDQRMRIIYMLMAQKVFKRIRLP